MNKEFEKREGIRMARRLKQKREIRQRLIKIGISIGFFFILAVSVFSLYIYGKNNLSAKASISDTTRKEHTKEITSTSYKIKETQESTTQTETQEISEKLNAIVTDYSKKIEKKTPVLIEEYKAEIQNNQKGVSGLSAIANRKARELQAISDEGISKLKKEYSVSTNSDFVDVEMFINQLFANYTEQVAKISDIYLRTRASFQNATSTISESSLSSYIPGETSTSTAH